MERLQDMATLTWPDWARLTWTGPHVKTTLPPLSFFQFPPSSQPSVLQPPPKDPSFAHPFAIPEYWYNLLLSPNVPITFALVYASAITLLNSVNARRNYKPWAISRTRLFKLFVLTHNAFLSLYSLWTFVGMINALRLSLEPPTGPYGLAGTLDSLCKLNGPRGFGSAATFNGTTNTWGFSDRQFHLNKDTNFPEASDVGRMWNEGLSFYGWIFYISKFYEVIDTLIIILKGKKSSFLQTYHHAGAMLCMWAGIRYMSPPIWIFVTFNSFVHFVMYAFYFLTTLGIRIPKPIKQTLTTLQITQFVVGATFAFAHLFVAYQVPFSTPYIYHLGDTIRSMVSSVSADASSVLSTATATASADPGSWLKKLALRAAGREGLAENIENRMHERFGVDAVHATKDFVRREETRYREELRFTHCIDTSGQTFAIYLNVFYLLPLTWLFAQFFIKSYLKRSDEIRRSSLSDRAYIASQSLNDASKGVGRRLSEAFEDYQGTTNGDLDGEPVMVDGDQIRKEIRALSEKAKNTGDKAVKQGKETVNAASEKVSQIDTDKVKQDFQADLEKVRKSAKSGAENVQETIKKNQPSQETKQKVKEVAKTAQDTASNVVSKAQQVASDASSKVQETYNSATSEESKQYLKETYESSSSNVKEAVNTASKKATEVKKDAQKGAEKAGSRANQIKDEVVDTASESEAQLEDKWQEVGKKSKKKAGQAKDTASKTAHDVTEAAQNKAEDVKDTASKKVSETKKEVDKKADSTKAAAEEKTEKAKDTARDTKDQTESTDIDKKDQDKIIAQSQTVRDETVGTKSDSTTSKSKSEVGAGGASYAAIAAENVPEEEKGDHVVIDDEDTTNTNPNSKINLNDSIISTNSLEDSYYHVNPNSMMNSSSSYPSNLNNSTDMNDTMDMEMTTSTSMLGGSSGITTSDGNVDTLLNLPADDLLPDIDPFPEIPPMTPRSKERWHARRRGDGSNNNNNTISRGGGGSAGVISIPSSPVSTSPITNVDMKGHVKDVGVGSGSESGKKSSSNNDHGGDLMLTSSEGQKKDSDADADADPDGYENVETKTETKLESDSSNIDSKDGNKDTGLGIDRNSNPATGVGNDDVDTSDNKNNTITTSIGSNQSSLPPSTTDSSLSFNSNPDSNPTSRPTIQSRRSTTSSNSNSNNNSTRPRHRRSSTNTSTSTSSNSYTNRNRSGSTIIDDHEAGSMSPEIPHSPSGMRWMY